MRAHPDFQREFLPGMAGSQMSPGEYLLIRAAAWPDDIRSPRHPSRRHHRADSHFINFPFPPERLLPARSEDIIKAIARHEGTLLDSGAKDSDKAIALSWIAHLVGDVHQPFHSVAMVSSLFPQGDRGGNSFLVRDGRRGTNLHSYWDSRFSEIRGFSTTGQQAADLVQRLPRTRFPELHTAAGPVDWARESFKLAGSDGYVFHNEPLPPARKLQDARELPQGYGENALTVAAARITLAGYRLADVLNGALPGL